MRAHVLLVCLTVAAAVSATEPPSADPAETVMTRTIQTESPGGLIDLINQWHDANLKADSDQIARSERRIVEFLRTDIERTRWRYEICRKRTQEFSSRPVGVPLTAEQLEALDDLASADQWLKVKKRLLKGFENSRAFSNRYRLAGDYLQILRMEQDQLQVKMAENENLE